MGGRGRFAQKIQHRTNGRVGCAHQLTTHCGEHRQSYIFCAKLETSHRVDSIETPRKMLRIPVAGSMSMLSNDFHTLGSF